LIETGRGRLDLGEVGYYYLMRELSDYGIKVSSSFFIGYYGSSTLVLISPIFGMYFSLSKLS